MLQNLILNAAVDSIERQMSWTLTRHFSFPKLAFKVTPGVTAPSTLRMNQDSHSSAAPAAQVSQSQQLCILCITRQAY